MGPAPGALTPTVLGQTLTYSISDFNNLNNGDLNFEARADSNVLYGTVACVTTTVQTNVGLDINPNNDSLTQCFIVFDSYDPNLKTVYPISTIDTGAQWLTYTVEFQNTGNDTAYTVIVKDTLSQYVDPSTFQYLASSNKAVIQLFGNAMVFTFPKINLPDSATNFTGSVGWIQYKVKTKPNLPLGIQINNTASIYFDLNPAVVTNTTVNTVQLDTTHTQVGIADIQTATIQVYPNPATQSCTITVSDANGIFAAQLLDISGREVSNLGILKSGGQTFSVSSFTKGVYMLRITDSQGQGLIRKLVIE